MTMTLVPPAELRPGPAAELGNAQLDAASLPGRAEILALGSRQPALTVSIVLPLHGTSADPEGDRERLAGMIARSRRLISEAHDERRADALLAPLRARIAGPAFWTNPPAALALFSTASALSEFRLP